MGPAQEMSLQQYVESLYKEHKARQEYKQLVADRLRRNITIIDLQAQLIAANNLLNNLEDASDDNLEKMEIVVGRLSNAKSLIHAQVEANRAANNEAIKWAV